MGEVPRVRETNHSEDSTKMTDTTFIYALSSPADPMNIRYIGKANDLKRRLGLHLREVSLYPKTHKSRWIKILLQQNIIPSISVLDEVPTEHWQHYEKHHIRLAKSAGFKLVNGTEGGDGGATNTGKKFSLTTRDKMSSAQKGRSGFTGAKNPFFGKRHSQETKEKMSQAKTIQYLGAGNPFFGKKHSLESLKKMSECKSGEKHNNFGKKHSPETRMKLSIAAKKREARKREVSNGIS